MYQHETTLVHALPRRSRVLGDTESAMETQEGRGRTTLAYPDSLNPLHNLDCSWKVEKQDHGK